MMTCRPNRFGETEAEVYRIGPGWESAEIRYRAWAMSDTHRRRVDRAYEIVLQFMDGQPVNPRIAWSGGKDSTAMLHLVTQRCGYRVRAMSVKDDLDYPEERGYVDGLAAELGIDLDVVEPASLSAWLSANRSEWEPGEDIHGRRAKLSDRFFYGEIDRYRRKSGSEAVFLGLRAKESAPREVHLSARGPIYRQRHSGQDVCCPLAHWTADDVFAYLLSSGVDPLPCYRYVDEHDDPGQIRKSWFLPGAHCRHGSAAFLRRWRPKLWAWVLRRWPEFSRWA